jgi:DNA-binding transcriptional ArsR family regulator
MDSMSTHVIAPDKQRLAKMLKALGNPVRFQIVEFLARHQTCITNDIVKNTQSANILRCCVKQV